MTVAKSMFERTSPQLVADITNSSVLLTGGMSQLFGLDKLISQTLNLDVTIPVRANLCVSKGCELALKRCIFLTATAIRLKLRKRSESDDSNLLRLWQGKTTAAIGQGMRAKGAGNTVTLVQFLKDNKSSELSVLPFDIFNAPDTLPFNPGKEYQAWVDSAIDYIISSKAI